ARRQTFNIGMDEPVDYGELGAYLARSRGLPTVGIRTPYHSTWLDNTKAKFLLGWRPRYDLRRMTDEAWSYQRAPGAPRVIWYPGCPPTGPRIRPKPAKGGKAVPARP